MPFNANTSFYMFVYLVTLSYVRRNYAWPYGPVTRDVEAEAEAGSGSGGSGPFSVEAEAEARKFHRFRFHIGGKNRGRKEIGSAILRRRTNEGSINIKK